MKRRQTVSHGATVGAHTLRAGDGGGAGAGVDVSQED
jgi:type IV secretion system protein TrbL